MKGSAASRPQDWLYAQPVQSTGRDQPDNNNDDNNNNTRTTFKGTIIYNKAMSTEFTQILQVKSVCAR